MPHDPYESCWGCPKPRPCDRSACEGWQYRESLKPSRYAARELKYTGTRDSLPDRKFHNRSQNAEKSKNHKSKQKEAPQNV